VSSLKRILVLLRYANLLSSRWEPLNMVSRNCT
jgi:hypothetical protein